MMAAAERRLWSAAAAVSAALHIALAFGLLVIPAPQPATTAATNIVMLSSQTRTAPTVAAASAGQAQATSVAPQAAEARVDRTAVAAVSEPLAAAGAGIELTPASRTTPDSAGLARRETADAARAQTDHRPVDPASGFEMVAAQRQDAPIRPVASFQHAGPRQSPEAARPPAASAAEQVTAHTSSAQPAEGGGAITQSSVSRPVRPVAEAGNVIAPAVTPARPTVTPAAEAAVAGDGTVARPTAIDTSRPSAPLEAIPSSPVEAVGRDSPAVQAPAATTAPAETGERVAAIMRPIAPTAARSHEDVETAYLDLLSTLRASRGESCVLALARLVGQSARVDRFFVAAADAVELDQRLRGDAVITIDHRRHGVTDAQCAALDFAASLASYPEPGLSIELRSAEIASGAVLSGRMSNLQRSWAYLLIVDDEGRVHQLHDLVMEEGALRFRAPLTLTGGPVATVQLLLALTSDSLLTSIRRNDGQEAGAYFEALKDDIEHSGSGVDFGMVPFLVRSP